jgi:hypothetical protein
MTLSGALVGCGGDDDDGVDIPPVTLDINAANSDTVAHATGAGLMAFGSTVMMPLDGGADRATALASTGSGTWLPPRVVSGLLQAMGGAPRSGGARPVAVIDLRTAPPARLLARKALDGGHSHTLDGNVRMGCRAQRHRG